MNLTLYGSPISRSLRAVWALEEAGAEYDYHFIALRKGEGRKPPFIDLNPGGKVPTLVVARPGEDDELITESLAIVTWTGEHYPDSGLVPGMNERDRSQYFRWSAFAISELEQPLWTLSKHLFAIPKKYRVRAVLDTARWEWSVAARILDDAVADREWILGDRFSGADILLGHSLKWAAAITGESLNDSLTAYMQRCFERPACLAAIAREDAFIEKSDA